MTLVLPEHKVLSFKWYTKGTSETTATSGNNPSLSCCLLYFLPSQLMVAETFEQLLPERLWLSREINNRKWNRYELNIKIESNMCYKTDSTSIHPSIRRIVSPSVPPPIHPPIHDKKWERTVRLTIEIILVLYNETEVFKMEKDKYNLRTAV